MDHSQFSQLANQGYNLIPLTLELYADLETPLSIYLKLANCKNTFLLESVVGGERFGRYSIIGLAAETAISCQANFCRVIDNDQCIEEFIGNPLDFIAEYQQRFNAFVPEDLPRFCGGLVGYFAYDTVRYIEAKLATCPLPDELDMPDILLLHCKSLAVIDNLKSKIWLIEYISPDNDDAYEQGMNKLNQLRLRLQQSLPPIASASYPPGQEIRNFSRDEYLRKVDIAKQYIKDGELMQVQLGQRINKGCKAAPLNFYRALRSLNPSPYMYFYHFGDFHVIGASPEILVRNEKTEQGNLVTIRPLAGTRKRGKTKEEDLKLAEELLNDPKEIAEHVMLIDLARNDIGRIAKVGSVKVSEQMVIERYSHVMHIVSNVEGILKDGMSNLDVLKATFPAGTLSGAPKVRAMQLIDQLELVKRGLYGGACGYLSYSGNMDLAIAIRTAIIKNEVLYVQAAAGIVADSIAESEWQETENKARALLKAAELAEAGLL